MKKIEILEARLAQLEAQSKQSNSSPQSTRNSGADPSSEGEQVWALRADSASTESPSYSTDPESLSPRGSNARTLPPLRMVLPIVEEYFESSNRVLPLFDRETFIKMLRGWYTYSAYRKSDAWAAINVVLALARRDSYASSPEETQNMQRYINNVQSVLNEIVIDEPTLLALQVVLGLVLVFHGSSDPRPAAIMVATAMRLVHGLNLHTKTTAEYIEPLEELQRNRTFWIAYILDRDCAMRTRQPPIHQDSEIDVDLPSPAPLDNAGLIFGVSGQVFNYFRTRVQLAYIQGKVYAMLHSVRATKLPEHERLQNTLRLREMLDDWERSIPAEFLPQGAVAVVPAQHLRYMSLLHYTHLQLVATTHYADSHHLEWLKEALSCSKKQAPRVLAESFAAQLPGCWGKLVEAARTCMRLYAATPENDSALTW